MLLPDIKGEANIVIEGWNPYLYHNLYYITSKHWPPKALQRGLQSGMARLFGAPGSAQSLGGSSPPRTWQGKALAARQGRPPRKGKGTQQSAEGIVAAIPSFEGPK